MLRQRIITAVVLLLILVGALAAGALAFVAFAALAFGAAVFEWLRFAAWPSTAAIAAGVAAGVVLFALEWSGARIEGHALLAVAGAACATWALAAVWVVRAEATQRVTLSNPAIALIAPVLLGGAWFSLLALYRRGALLLFSALAVVWIADISAYFAGRAFGKRKLAPNISPGKTRAGAVGAVLTVLLVATGVRLAWPQAALFSNDLITRSPALAAFTLAALVLVSIVGDLFESLLKRHAGVKDSSGLLPGHGGVLDRIDALLAVLPAAALIEVLL